MKKCTRRLLPEQLDDYYNIAGIGTHFGSWICPEDNTGCAMTAAYLTKTKQPISYLTDKNIMFAIAILQSWSFREYGYMYRAGFIAGFDDKATSKIDRRHLEYLAGLNREPINRFHDGYEDGKNCRKYLLRKEGVKDEKAISVQI